MSEVQPIALIGRMLWLPEETAPLERLQEDLTLYTSAFRGKGEKVTVFERHVIEGRKYIGVPRMWGLDKRKWLLGSMETKEYTARPFIRWPEVEFNGGGYRLGQKEAVEAISDVFAKGSYGALVEGKCGVGKTLIGLDIASRLHTPALVIVHKTDLADQWKETAHGGVKEGVPFKGMFPDVEIGHVQGDKWVYEDCHFVTAVAQTLYSRKDEIPQDFLQNFGLVIFDEGHRYPARTFEHVLRMFPARFRMAVSATWRRSDGMECVWHWHVGHLEHRVKSKPLTGEYVQVPWSTRLEDKMFRIRGVVNIARFVNAIGCNEPYNVWLANQLAEGASVGRRVLCVSDRIEHLYGLRSRLLAKGVTASIGMYVGSTPAPEGRKIGKKPSKEELDHAKTCDIVLATYGMMAEGTDIPALDTLFIGTPRADVEQVVGRIQRHKDDKKKLLIVDPVFGTKYMQSLADKRRRVYQDLGFTEQSK